MQTHVKLHFPGLLLATIIALAATFLSEHYGTPVMLFALLIGMAFNFAAGDQVYEAGIEFSSKTLLRLGVGLLGLRLSVGEISNLGASSIIAVIIFVLATLACGALLSLLLGRGMAFGLLAGGAVAICGASAALAITSVLPHRSDREKDTLFVIVAVTTLSTIAMVTYPVLLGSLGLNDVESGFVIGASIHDVAQVVGAGYSISDEAGVVATYVKMLRVALLPVVIFVAMFSFRGAQVQRVGLPWFLVLFVVLALAVNLATIPAPLLEFSNQISSWCLVIAISALGVKTNLSAFFKVKPSYSLILIFETLFLLSLVLIYTVVWGIQP